MQVERNPFFKIFTNMIFQAWEARELLIQKSENPMVTPRIVLSIRNKLSQTDQNAENHDTQQPYGSTESGATEFVLSMPMGCGDQDLLYGIGGQESYVATGLGAYPDMFGQAPFSFDVNQLNWSAMDWDLVNAPTGMAGE